MDKIKVKNKQQARRAARVRSKISGSAARPRLSVYRSNKGMFLQLVDDTTGRTLASAAMKEVKAASKVESGKELGKLIAQKAKGQKINQAVFDRGSYRYHGRVKAVAEGAREGGLVF